jgi:catechol-2,3-dioxygenase
MNHQSFGKAAGVLHRRLPRIAFEYPTMDALLSAYARLKEMGVEPVLSANFGGITAFYYLDPAGSCIKLVAKKVDQPSAFTRLKEMGIKTVLSANHARTNAFYYLDPDGNCIKLVADNSADQQKSRDYMRTSVDFSAHLMRALVDAYRIVAGRQAEPSSEVLHLATLHGMERMGSSTAMMRETKKSIECFLKDAAKAP